MTNASSSDNQPTLSNKEASGRRVLNSIYIAKGIGIFLVAVGHYFPQDSPEYWRVLRGFIYSFHMPLFFCLSGYFMRSISPEKYLNFIQSKLSRLMLPFASIALLFFLLKLGPSLFLDLEHPVSLASLGDVLINPIQSYMPLLWFIYTLFIILALYPILEWIFKRRIMILWVCIACSFLPLTPYFSLNLVANNISFFALGAVLSSRLDLEQSLTPERSTALTLGLIVGLPVLLMTTILERRLNIEAGGGAIVINQLQGFWGIGICLAIAMLLNNHLPEKIAKILINTGFFSMSIYLFHTLFESSVRVVVTQILNIQGLFELTAIFAIAAGMVFPLLLERYCLRKFSFSRKFLLGLPS